MRGMLFVIFALLHIWMTLFMIPLVIFLIYVHTSKRDSISTTTYSTYMHVFTLLIVAITFLLALLRGSGDAHPQACATWVVRKKILSRSYVLISLFGKYGDDMIVTDMVICALQSSPKSFDVHSAKEALATTGGVVDVQRAACCFARVGRPTCPSTGVESERLQHVCID
jgi:hypothetical protein